MAVKRFLPEKPLTRFEYLKGGVLVGLLIVSFILRSLIKDYSSNETIIGVALLFLIWLMYVLSFRFTKEILVDETNQTLSVSYFTLLKDSKCILPLNSLSYSMRHAPTFRDSNRRQIIFYNKKGKIFRLDNRHGYSKSVLLSLAVEMERFEVPCRNSSPSVSISFLF